MLGDAVKLHAVGVVGKKYKGKMLVSGYFGPQPPGTRLASHPVWMARLSHPVLEAAMRRRKSMSETSNGCPMDDFWRIGVRLVVSSASANHRLLRFHEPHVSEDSKADGQGFSPGEKVYLIFMASVHQLEHTYEALSHSFRKLASHQPGPLTLLPALHTLLSGHIRAGDSFIRNDIRVNLNLSSRDMTDEQKQVGLKVLQSSSALHAILGPAGSGKSTVMGWLLGVWNESLHSAQ